MSDRNVPPPASSAGAEKGGPVAAGASPLGLAKDVAAPGAPSPGAPPGAPSPGAPADGPPAGGAAGAGELPQPLGDAPVVHPTAPVSSRPVVRARRQDPLTRMGPWAPVACAAVGALLGVLVVVLLRRTAEGFGERLSLVFVVLGLSVLGAGGALLADEVRMLRRRAETVRGQWAEATAGALNGLTPARLLLAVAAFILFLAAYVLPN